MIEAPQLDTFHLNLKFYAFKLKTKLERDTFWFHLANVFILC